MSWKLDGEKPTPPEEDSNSVQDFAEWGDRPRLRYDDQDPEADSLGELPPRPEGLSE